jgi:hypothetical protein
MMMRFTLLAVALVALSTQMKARADDGPAPDLRPGTCISAR